MKYLIIIILFFSGCTPAPKQTLAPAQVEQPQLATGTFTAITLGGTRATGISSVFGADTLSKEKLVNNYLLYKTMKANETTFYKDGSVLGKGTQADPFRVNPALVIQKGTAAYIKANAKEGQLWYDTDNHTLIFHNGYGAGLRSVNSSNVQ